MKIVIIGGVAAGSKTAAKVRRELPQAEVVIYTKSQEISYAGCGLPYYVGGGIENRESLVVNTPESFEALTGAAVHTGCQVTGVDPEEKTILVNGQKVSYDRLVIATGGEPVWPAMEGIGQKGVFSLRTPEDAVSIRSYLEKTGCKEVVVAGGGFIGLELAENLLARGLGVTVVELAPQLLSGAFDGDMADLIRRKLREKGIRVLTGTKVEQILGTDGVTGVRTSTGTIPAQAVVLAVGIRPATAFLEGTGLAMERGCILTDAFHRTNLPNIYAVGDCAMVVNRITGKRQWSAMGSTANITGRNLAGNLAGEERAYPGCLGTGVVRLGDDLNAARTGLTEQGAKEAGFQPICVTCTSDNKAHYAPDAGVFITKLVADRDSHMLLGLQVVGKGSVDKMADIAVTGISLGAKVEDFTAMDFAYAPPFSTAIHPFAVACTALGNKLSGRMESFTPAEYAAGAAKGYRLIDVHPAPTLPGGEWLDLSKAEEALGRWSKETPLLLCCAKGRRAYLTQRKLKALGFTNTRILEGGAVCNVIKAPLPSGGKLPPQEIKRVKALGCLQDKRYGDVFNVRVITVNGKITAEDHRIIAQAAEIYGSREITMTTRLTLEIQGVRYENIQPLIDFLAEHGLETGGTGSLVRPVVSCKGTTCQYGLIDTFGLSEQIHRRFYKGYRGVTLPHKFKIAVGGCPNNCVKPDLNDLGIVGQRVPLLDLSKCRGCKKCQVETACPIHVAHMDQGLLKVDPQACNGCGRCTGKCPFGVTEETMDGYRVYIGGRWGKKIANGRPLSKLFTTEAEVLDVVERAILLFRDEGITGERFADTVSRLGFAYVEEKLLSGSIDKGKILEKTVTGGATC